MVKISIITACYNNEQTIKKTLESVASQTHDNIEHIIIDGKSTDKTLDIIAQFPHVSKIVSEKDEGIYDALNKGLKEATGDIIGFLHSDDTFMSKDVLTDVAKAFEQDNSIDGIYGDIQFVNETGKVVRHYSSKKFQFSDFAKGKMPAHTSFFARKKVYDAFPFDTNYRIAADFDQMLRVMTSGKFKINYVPLTTTKMLVGGASTRNIQARITINKEILQSCRTNGIKTSIWKVYSKYLKKVFEFINP